MRGGTHADGTPKTHFGFLDGQHSLVIQTVVLPFPGDPPDPAEIAGMNVTACTTAFEGMRLAC